VAVLAGFVAVLHSPSSGAQQQQQPAAPALSLSYQIVGPNTGSTGSGTFDITSLSDVVRDTPATLITVDGAGHFVPEPISSVSCGVYWHPKEGSSAIYLGSSRMASCIEAGATWEQLIASGPFAIDDSLYGSFFTPDFFTTLNPQCFGGSIVFSFLRQHPAP